MADRFDKQDPAEWDRSPKSCWPPNRPARSAASASLEEGSARIARLEEFFHMKAARTNLDKYAQCPRQVCERLYVNLPKSHANDSGISIEGTVER